MLTTYGFEEMGQSGLGFEPMSAMRTLKFLIHGNSGHEPSAICWELPLRLGWQSWPFAPTGDRQPDVLSTSAVLCLRLRAVLA